MAFLGKSLADGQLPNAQAALYTVGAGLRAVLKTIDIVSRTGTVQTVEIYLKRSGGTARRLCRVSDLDQDEKIELLSDGNSLSLSTGDAIEGVTTTASAVDYTITGAEETV